MAIGRVGMKARAKQMNSDSGHSKLKRNINYYYLCLGEMRILSSLRSWDFLTVTYPCIDSSVGLLWMQRLALLCDLFGRGIIQQKTVEECIEWVTCQFKTLGNFLQRMSICWHDFIKTKC